MILVNTIATLTGLSSVAANETAFVEGYNSPGDSGGGEFYYDSGSSATVNNGTVFSSAAGGRWFRLLDGKRVSARWFGAYGNGSTNDQPYLQAALDYCGANGVGLYIPGGSYSITAPTNFFGLTIQYGGILVEGDGYDTEIKAADYVQYNSVIGLKAISGQIQNITVRNLRVNGNKGAQNAGGGWNSKCITVYVDPSLSDKVNVTLEGLHCHNAYSSNIAVDGEGGGISVYGNDPTFSIVDYYPTNILITNCFCWDNNGWGIGTNYTNAILVSNNTCWDNDTMGITLFNTQDCVVNGNICYNNVDYGINLELCDRITASGNKITGNNNGCFKTYNTVNVVAANNVLIRTSNFYAYSNFQIVSGAGYSGGSYKQRPCSSLQISDNNMVVVAGIEGFCISATNGGYDPNHDIVIQGNILVNESVNKGIEANIDNVMIANNVSTGRIYVNSIAGEAFVQNNKVYYPDCASSLRLIEINGSYKVIVSGNSVETAANGIEGIYLDTNPSYFGLVCENTASGPFSAAAGAAGGVTWTNRNNLLF